MLAELNMPENPFTDKNIKPDDKSLAKVLGEFNKLWNDLKRHLRESYGELIEEWKFYSPKYGWTLKLLKKKRNLFFFSPRPNGFRVSFVFGDKAVSHIEASNLPDEMKTALDDLIDQSEAIENGKMLYDIIDFNIKHVIHQCCGSEHDIT